MTCRKSRYIVLFVPQQEKTDQDVLDLESLKRPENEVSTAEKQRDKLSNLEIQLAAAAAAVANDPEETPPNENVVKQTLDSDDTQSENTASNSDRAHGAPPKVSVKRNQYLNIYIYIHIVVSMPYLIALCIIIIERCCQNSA